MTMKTSPELHIGPPQISAPLAVYPILGGKPTLCYRSLGQAVKRGVFIAEVDEHGSVNDVLVSNASDQPVLLYEGEVIVGARQNRTMDMPVLVPAGVELRAPVSCVERGRWEHGRRAERLRPSPHAIDPNLRRTKRTTANARGPAAEEARPEQGEVWLEVETRLGTHQVASPSASFTDIFDAKRITLDQLKEPIRALDGQVGTVVEIAGRPVVLDLVSRPDVFADLLPGLTDGYALQAIEWSYHPAASDSHASTAAATDFLAAVLTSPLRWLPNPGLGDAFAPSGQGLNGCGLRVDRELVAVSAFPNADD
jgi:hypothetical protein